MLMKTILKKKKKNLTQTYQIRPFLSLYDLYNLIDIHLKKKILGCLVSGSANASDLPIKTNFVFVWKTIIYGI